MACAREHNLGIQQKEFLKKKKAKESKIPKGISSFVSANISLRMYEMRPTHLNGKDDTLGLLSTQC
jgi:hypothetical protein